MWWIKRGFFLLTFWITLLIGQGGSVGCGDVVVDQIPFTYIDSTVGSGDNVDVSGAGAGNGEDFLFTLNVSDTIMVDISLCHSETVYDAQMGLYILDDTCGVDTTAPSTCRYPTSSQGGSQVDCFAEDAQACTESVAPTNGAVTASYRPIIYEYELYPLERWGLGMDGFDDFAQIDDQFISSSTFSIAVWALADADQSGLKAILSINEGTGTRFYIGKTTGGNIRLGPNWDDTGVAFPLDDEWHYYTIVSTSGNTILYLDGFQVAELGSGIGNPNGSSLYLGKQVTPDLEHFKGDLFDVAIWSSDLSSAEIAALYNTGIPLNAAENSGDYVSSGNLTGYYRCDEGSGTTINDKSGNSAADGNIVDATWVESAPGSESTFYIVVDGYQGATGGFKLSIDSTKAPQIDSSNVDSANTWVDVIINEPIFDNNEPWNSATAVQGDDFSIAFSRNGGIATAAAIQGISQQDGNPLVGGERIIRFELNVTGYVTGLETIEIKPIDGNSVFDGGGTAMAASMTSGPIYLNGDPIDYLNFIIKDDNSYGILVFDQDVYSNSDSTGVLDPSDLILTFNQNAFGSASAGALDNLTDASGNPLTAGEDSMRVYFSITGTPNGNETIEIASEANSVFNKYGLSRATGGGIADSLYDKLSPTMISGVVTDTNSILLITSEPVRDAGNNPLSDDDVSITYTQNAGNATAASIGSMQDIGTAHNWANDTVLVLLDITNRPSGVETIEITPLNAASIEDHNNNAMDAAQTTGVLTLKDKLPPMWDSTLTNLVTSNAYLTLSSSEGMFTDSDGLIPLESSDFVVDFNANSGTATGVSIASVKRPDALSLVGGEDSIWVYLNVTGSPSGVEIFNLTAGSGAIYDNNGNAMDDTATSGRLTLNRYPRILTNDVELDPDNEFIKLVLNEGIFSDAAGTLPIVANDFQILFNQNNGNAIGAAIDSLKKTDGNDLAGNEDTVIVYINLTNSPASGVETIEIKAANASSIYNSIGNALTTSETTNPITLNDKLAPFVMSSSLTLDTVATLIVSESVFTESNGTNPLTIADFELTFSNNGGNATSASITIITKTDGSPLAGGETEVSVHFEPDDIASGVETIEITPEDNVSIYDQAGNPMGTQQTSGILTLPDRLSPEIDSTKTAIASSNAYVALSISEGLYTNESGDAALLISDFKLEFDDNGGNATDTEITHITQAGGNSLFGNEDSLWVYLEVTGTPSGTERIMIHPDEMTSVYDGNGNAMESESSSGWVSLNSYPRILKNEIALDDENSFVKFVLSEGVYGNSSASTPMVVSDLQVTFSQNEGNAAGANLTSVTKTNGSVLAGGEDSIFVYFTLSNPPASGPETIEIKSANNNSVFNALGNALTSIESTDSIKLNDKLVPTFVEAALTLDSAVTVTISEGVFTNADGTGWLLPADFEIDVEQNGGNAASATIVALTRTDGSALIGGETEILVHFTLNDLPSGVEQIEVRPATDASVFDLNGNAMPMALTTGGMLLNDRLPPRIQSTSNLTWDNKIEILLTEGSYTASSGTGGIEDLDFYIELHTNGGNTNAASIGSITSEVNTALTGGEITIHLHLDFDFPPSGVETIRGYPSTDSSIFDASGNAMFNTETTPVFILNDELPPSITNVSLEDQDTLPLIVSNEIEYTISEPLKSFELMVTAKYNDSLRYTLDTSVTTLTLTLIPPLASLDTITITWDNLIDSANVVHDPPVIFTYYTPALGDYNWDKNIDIEDLSNLVTAWYNSDYTYELGPVTGKIPHYIPITDDEFGLDDGMAFTQMWYWINHSGSLSRPYRNKSGSVPEIEITAGKIVITPPKSSSAGQLFLEYDPAQIDVSSDKNSPIEPQLFLPRKNEALGQVLVEFADVSGKDIPEIEFLKQTIGRSNSDMTVTYVFYNRDGSIIGEGTDQRTVISIPTVFALHPVYPNPFNPSTTIRFDIPVGTLHATSLQIFDITGRMVETLLAGKIEAGFHEIIWSGSRQSSGVYFAELLTGDERSVQKMILLK